MNRTLGCFHCRFFAANDNAPHFEQSRYHAHIDRSRALVGTRLLTVSASDADVGANAQIEYRLQSSGGVGHPFAIDTASGVISLVESLTTASTSVYELLAIARDFGQPQPLESTAFVTITIVNGAKDSSTGVHHRRRHRIKVIYLSEDGTARVGENATIGQLIARIGFESDNDDDDTITPTVAIGGTHAEYFVLQPISDQPNVLLLVLAREIDRETVANISLTLMASASGEVLAEVPVTLTVDDVNDNAPIFTSSIYEATVRERSTRGTVVLRVSATDADGPDHHITYRLRADAPYDRWFTIDASSGVVSTAQAIDCELSSRIRLDVEACDNGDPSQTSTAQVCVNYGRFTINCR
jgi:hypothetical protein